MKEQAQGLPPFAAVSVGHNVLALRCSVATLAVLIEFKSRKQYIFMELWLVDLRQIDNFFSCENEISINFEKICYRLKRKCQIQIIQSTQSFNHL